MGKLEFNFVKSPENIYLIGAEIKKIEEWESTPHKLINNARKMFLEFVEKTLSSHSSSEEAHTH